MSLEREKRKTSCVCPIQPEIKKNQESDKELEEEEGGIDTQYSAEVEWMLQIWTMFLCQQNDWSKYDAGTRLSETLTLCIST